MINSQIDNEDHPIEEPTTVTSTSAFGTTITKDTRFLEYITPDWQESENQQKFSKYGSDTISINTKNSNSMELSEKQLRFLKTAFFNKNKASTKITQLAGIASSTAQKYRKHLKQLGFLKEKRIATGPENQESIFLEVTNIGMERIKSNRKK